MAYHRISKNIILALEIHAIIPALVVVNIPEGISATIICLLTIYSGIDFGKITRIQKSPTYIFIIVIYITASVSVLATTLLSFGWADIGFFQSPLGLAMSASFLAAAIMAQVEVRIIA